MLSRKGIILAGGKGTRLFPLTKSISKQLLPIYNKPMIYYPLSTLMHADIREILIITQSHFIPLYKSLFGDGSHLGLSIQYQAQDIPSGIAEAFIIGEDFIGNDPVALILGDNIFYGSELNSQLSFLSQSTEINLFSCSVSNASQFGVLQYENDNPIKIIEKPKAPPSNEAITGLYFYNSNVVSVAKTLQKSERGELEITDINNHYLLKKTAKVNKLSRETLWLDTGSFENLQRCSQIIYSIEKNTQIMIGCIEEIAFQKAWINKKTLKEIADSMADNDYSRYLNKYED